MSFWHAQANSDMIYQEEPDLQVHSTPPEGVSDLTKQWTDFFIPKSAIHRGYMIFQTTFHLHAFLYQMFNQVLIRLVIFLLTQMLDIIK